MEADIAQIKVLLWIILAILALFVVSNILCRVFNCGKSKGDRLVDLWHKGRTEDVITKSQALLRDNPHDITALYFGSKALAASGLHATAREYTQRLMLIEPEMRKQCQEQLEAIDRMTSGT